MAESVPWGKLSESSRAYVIGLIRRLADGYSGEIRLECHEGGVRALFETRRPKAEEFERYRGGAFP